VFLFSSNKSLIALLVSVGVLAAAITSLIMSFLNPLLALPSSALLCVLSVWEGRLKKSEPIASSKEKTILAIIRAVSLVIAICFVVNSVLWTYSKVPNG
jgi:riboflavin transporter FmnP